METSNINYQTTIKLKKTFFFYKLRNTTTESFHLSLISYKDLFHNLDKKKFDKKKISIFFKN
jgi:hypothetical protein